MKPSIFTALALVTAVPVAAVSGAPAIAQASDCETQVASLRSATETVSISGKNADRDRDSLVRTLDSASIELSKGKNPDAAKKLTDYRVKVEQLAEAGRLSSTDAASLVSQANSAIACLNGNGTG